MPYGMYLSAEGAQAQSRRLEVLANNLANINTPGFKRDVPTFQARFAEAMEEGDVLPGTGALEDQGGGVEMADVLTDFSPGTLKRTGIPTDLALGGQGFFQVQNGDGEVFLTRAGNFSLNAQGELITENGRYHVLDESGAPIALTENQPWHTTNDGTLVQDGNVVPLAIVNPRSLGDLDKFGDNLFRMNGPVDPVELNQRLVRQGFVELSSVNPTTEMMHLIETSRAFEANTKLIQHQDHMIGALISRVLQS